MEPLRNFPVIRDLVVESGDFMRKLVRVKPWIVRHEEKPIEEGEYLQTPEEMDEYKQFSMCINCMLCYSACPIYGLDPKFVGPAALALVQRYNLDSRDEGAARARSCRNTRESGDAPSLANARRSVPRMSILPVPSSATNWMWPSNR